MYSEVDDILVQCVRPLTCFIRLDVSEMNGGNDLILLLYINKRLSPQIKHI